MHLVILSGCCVGTGLSGVCKVDRVGMVWVFWLRRVWIILSILVEEEEVCIFGVRSFDITVWYLSVRYALPGMGSAYLFYVYLCVAGF